MTKEQLGDLYNVLVRLIESDITLEESFTVADCTNIVKRLYDEKDW